MQLALDAPVRTVRFEITVAQVRRQIAKRSLAVNAGFSAGDRFRARIAGINLDWRSFEPPSFVQSDGNRQRLLARGAGRAPDSQRRAAVSRVPPRQQCLDERSHLIEFAPEVCLLD